MGRNYRVVLGLAFDLTQESHVPHLPPQGTEIQGKPSSS